MHISQLVPVPEGLRAIFVAVFETITDDGTEENSCILDRPVDAMALLELDARDIRAGELGGRSGASRGHKTKVVGLILEAGTEGVPAPKATAWLERLYGDRLVGSAFLGYTRGESVDEIFNAVRDDDTTPEMDETRRYWARRAREAIDSLKRE